MHLEISFATHIEYLPYTISHFIFILVPLYKLGKMFKKRDLKNKTIPEHKITETELGQCNEIQETFFEWSNSKGDLIFPGERHGLV